MAGRQPQRPNLLVTGTPGVGKTSLCKALAECTQMEHLNVGDIVKEHGFVVEKDLEFDTLIPDEDPLLDYMEDLLVEGGKIVDYHSSELFPERWFQLVVVLRCTTESLFDRLTARGYSEKKRDENMQCEIIGVSSEEAKESYTSCPVWELPSNSVDDQETVLEKLQEWAGQNGLGEQ